MKIETSNKSTFTSDFSIDFQSLRDVDLASDCTNILMATHKWALMSSYNFLSSLLERCESAASTLFTVVEQIDRQEVFVVVLLLVKITMQKSNDHWE